ncbi:tetraacyldisaccharide 4'-kinase [Campylobacter sp. RM16192]|uniref:tetraacyldisaccharide 4'-kinase n=1 Tax=Campylobacter sp. RM16192 TaxID=1660080 RepID=UPI0014520E2D|nr:tetraacyldisaccharide 4'-kinase [Campylobacter sp. RM16192]QCD52856.1 tetraacyldisaccharide 4'-kinase [Campylobacter sp. RM16192]
MFKRYLYSFAERYFYRPNLVQKILSILLLPISCLYFLIIFLKFKLSSKINFDIPIISVGNLTLGGSGKTPLGIAIANEFEGGFIILRGYKRSSKGLVKICINGEILTDVKTSGDEAMEYSKSVQNANVIVSENRDEAIKLAKQMGARYILLDDGFSKFYIKKFDILLRPKIEPFFKFTIPSGAYRYPPSFYKFADFIAIEGRDFIRQSEILNSTERMVLVTAIANPMRLKPFLNHCVGHEFFPDHHSFSKIELEKILNNYNANSLLVTKKDLVKIEDFNLPLSVINLKVTLSKELKDIIKTCL